MKNNILIVILIIGLLVLGFLYFKEQEVAELGAGGCNTNSASSVTVTSPNGGEAYQVGGQFTVTWVVCNVNASEVNISLETSAVSQSQSTLLAPATENDGTQLVVLPEVISSGEYYIQVNTLVPNFHSDFSDDTFSISNPTTTFKTYSGHGFKIDYPKDMIVQEEDAEGGPYRMIYFSRGGISISYVQNAAWFEQHDLAELEYTGSQIINGNTFKIYQGNEHSRMWLRTGNTGYALNINGLGDGDGLPGIDINTFHLLNQ